MKRIIALFILTLLTTVIYAQWNKSHSTEGYCSHLKSINNNIVFTTDYSWQSKFLFDYDVTSYMLDIVVSDTTTYVEGNAIINCRAIVPIDTFAFELIIEQNIDSIIINGNLYTNYSRDGANVLVPVVEFSQGSDISAQIYYHGQPPEGGFFTGVNNDSSTALHKNVTWTLSEPFSAKQWFPVKQDLQDKADSAWLFFTTSSGNMVGSEGLLTDVVDVGNNMLRYEWKTNYPIDYYLISFAVADYADYSIYAHPTQMAPDSLLIQNFLYNNPAHVESKKASIAKTADMMVLFSDLFTLYPFYEEKYGHCEAQIGGGMEHQTMSTMANFSFHLVAHELGHMWFGDNVTCATWSDIWINEGFATYSDYLANEFLNGEEAATNFIVGAQQDAMSADAGSVYIPEEYIFPGNEWRIFSGRLSYNKGAAIIHMLRHEIQNDEKFFEVLKTFQINFAGGTATGEDFRNTAETVTGMDFEQFFGQWYYGHGFPRYNFVYWNDDQNIFNLSSTQTTSSEQTPIFNMLLDFRLVFDDGTDTIVRFKQTDNQNVFSKDFGKKVIHMVVDPNNWTLEEVRGLSYVKETNVSPIYFTIGPVPALEKLNIYFLNPDTVLRDIKITSISGQIIFIGETKASSFELNTIDFESGIYFITVSDGQNTITKKFIAH